MNMREKIARAIFERRKAFQIKLLEEIGVVELRIARAKAQTWDNALPIERENSFAFADAALEALTEPTLEMLHGGNCAEWYGGIQGKEACELEEVKKVFVGAIEAAKAEK